MIEEWRSVSGFEGFYEVSSAGRVRSLDRVIKAHLYRGQVLVAVMADNGYRRVGLYRGSRQKNKQVSHLVAEAFIGPRPESFQVCHCDGDRSNDAVGNLRYDSHSGNQRDRVRHGTSSSGAQNGRVKLNANEVREIIRLWPSLSQSELGRRFGVNASTIRRIVLGERWRDEAEQALRFWGVPLRGGVA